MTSNEASGRRAGPPQARPDPLGGSIGVPDDRGVVSSYDRPIPVGDPDGAEYYAGLKAHRLMMKFCLDCSRHHFYPRELCPHCHSDRLDWRQVKGEGEIYTYTIARRPAGPAFKPQVPYIVAIVQLDEGPRMMVNMPSSDLDRVGIGRRVRIVYDDVTPDVTLPRFTLL